MPVIFEDLEQATIQRLNENVIQSLTDVVDSLLRKAEQAVEVEDKTRLVAKSSGILHVVNTYGVQLTQVKTFKEVHSLLNVIHVDFQNEASEPVSRGIDIAGVTILEYVN